MREIASSIVALHALIDAWLDLAQIDRVCSEGHRERSCPFDALGVKLIGREVQSVANHSLRD